jgi:hypothetical protein
MGNFVAVEDTGDLRRRMAEDAAETVYSSITDAVGFVFTYTHQMRSVGQKHDHRKHFIVIGTDDSKSVATFNTFLSKIRQQGRGCSKFYNIFMVSALQQAALREAKTKLKAGVPCAKLFSIKAASTHGTLLHKTSVTKSELHTIKHVAVTAQKALVEDLKKEFSAKSLDQHLVKEVNADMEAAHDRLVAAASLDELRTAEEHARYVAMFAYLVLAPNTEVNIALCGKAQVAAFAKMMLARGTVHVRQFLPPVAHKSRKGTHVAAMHAKLGHG